MFLLQSSLRTCESECWLLKENAANINKQFRYNHGINLLLELLLLLWYMVFYFNFAEEVLWHVSQLKLKNTLKKANLMSTHSTHHKECLSNCQVSIEWEVSGNLFAAKLFIITIHGNRECRWWWKNFSAHFLFSYRRLHFKLCCTKKSLAISHQQIHH